MPLDGILAEIGAGEIGALALDGGEALQVESDRRVGLVARGDELARQHPRRTGLAEAIEHPAAFAEAVEEAGFAEQFQMTRHTRLALPQDLGQFADRQLAAGAEHDEPQPGRLGDRTQGSEQLLHRLGFLFRRSRKDIQISLYVQANNAI